MISETILKIIHEKNDFIGINLLASKTFKIRT